ncbi:host specificity protein J [Escherichia coli]|nr:host specificity protein J [Escherichia coli]
MGKGGGRAHTPVEAKDNLKSTQMMSVIDAIGEGPIEGPVKGLQRCRLYTYEAVDEEVCV